MFLVAASWEGEGVLLASGGEKPGMLSDILQGRGIPLQQRVPSAEAESYLPIYL